LNVEHRALESLFIISTFDVERSMLDVRPPL
jgi:hypothetical protein